MFIVDWLLSDLCSFLALSPRSDLSDYNRTAPQLYSKHRDGSKLTLHIFWRVFRSSYYFVSLKFIKWLTSNPHFPVRLQPAADAVRDMTYIDGLILDHKHGLGLGIGLFSLIFRCSWHESS